MLIRHYWAAGGLREFDPASGSVSMRRFRGEIDSWGSAWKQQGHWFVLWHDGDSLILQSGRRQWRLNSELTLDVTGHFRRSFRIRARGELEFEFNYWFKGALWSRIDPTYDGIDEESDDFFLYVTGMWGYWKNRPADEFLANLADVR